MGHTGTTQKRERTRIWEAPTTDARVSTVVVEIDARSPQLGQMRPYCLPVCCTIRLGAAKSTEWSAPPRVGLTDVLTLPAGKRWRRLARLCVDDLAVGSVGVLASVEDVERHDEVVCWPPIVGATPIYAWLLWIMLGGRSAALLGDLCPTSVTLCITTRNL